MRKCNNCGKPVKSPFILCYPCYVASQENKRRVIEAMSSDIDDFDDLGICPICEDRYTPGGVMCSSCSQQDWIDKHG